jgi:hypothetical protein
VLLLIEALSSSEVIEKAGLIIPVKVETQQGGCNVAQSYLHYSHIT